MKRIKAFAVSALLLLCFCMQSIAGHAATQPSLSMENVYDEDSTNNLYYAQAEDEVKIAISLKGNNISVGAFSFSLTYDATKLKYESGSLSSIYFDGISVYDKGGKLNFAWDSTKNVGVKTGIVFKMTFMTSADYTEDTVIDMAKGVMYSIPQNIQGDLEFTKVFEVETPITATVTPNSTPVVDESVQSVIDMIDALGEPVATEEYKQALDTALNAYAELSYAQQKKVLNYQELATKYSEYLGMVSNTTSTEAKAWLSEYEAVLQLRADTVEFEDKETIENALEAWEALPTNAKFETTNQRLLLKSLLNIIDEVYAEQLEQQEQEKLMAEAQELADGYKIDWKNVLVWEVDQIESGHLTFIQQAEAALNGMQGLGTFDLAYNILVADGTYAHLQALKEKALEEYAKDYPEDAEYITRAEKFKSQFGYVLGMEVDDLTYEDVADINTAYIAYDFLDAKTKSYLETEYSKLEELMMASDNLLPEEEDTESETQIDTESETEIVETVVTEEKLVEVTKWLSGSDNYDVTFVMRGVSQFIKIFLVLDIVAFLLFVFTKVMFYIVRKKHEKHMSREV